MASTRPPRLLAWWGWRATVASLGAAYFVLAALMLLVLHRADGRDAAAVRGPIRLRDVPWGDARLWIVCLTYAGIYAFITSVQLHLHAFLTDLGHTPADAAGVLSTLTLVGAVGAPLFGWFAERTSARLGLLVVVTGLTASSLVLWNTHDLRTFTLWAVFYGLVNSGVVALLTLVLAELFGAAQIGPDGRRDGRLHERDDGGQRVRRPRLRHLPRLSPAWETYSALMALTLLPTLWLWRARDGGARRHRRARPTSTRVTVAHLRRRGARTRLVARARRVGAAECPDCDGDGAVVINELVTGIGIALGSAPLASCPAFDRDADGTVAIDEIIAAVGAALNGCDPGAATPSPTATPTPSPAPTGPPPTEPTALLAWLQAGSYLDWAAESAIHPSAGPHGGKVRTYLNPAIVASLSAGDAQHPAGAAAVKGLYFNGDTVRGWAVMVKLQADSDAGRGWYWYELFGSGPPLQGVGTASAPAPLHGRDFVLIPSRCSRFGTALPPAGICWFTQPFRAWYSTRRAATFRGNHAE